MRTDYITNAQNSVRRYSLNPSGALVSSPVEYYPANTLTGERVTDEEGHTLETYKDLLGNIILERRDGNKDTYYVYEKGMLRVVVPPLYKTNPSVELLYQYKYDAWGRCIEKTLPGCTPISYTYDLFGRLAFMQDGRMMDEGAYRFYLYDELNRLVVQGTCSNLPTNMSSLPANVSYEFGNAYVENTGYKVKTGYNPTNAHIEIVNYFDNYDFLSNSSVNTYIGSADLSNNSHANATSLLTGQIVSTSNGKYLCTALYYDEKGNVIERKETLLNGAVLSTATSYSFTSKPLTTTMTLTRKGVTRTVTQTNEYDQNSDRLVSQQHKYGTKPTVSTAIFTYNDLGQIQTLSQHNGALSTSYSYDVHGWLTDINSVVSGTGTSLFQEKLKYVDATRGMGYNGNISEARWVSGSINSSYRYKYTYDGMDRLTGAAFYAGGPINNDNASFIDDLGSVSVQYNANSSITSLVRRGQLDYGYGAIDNLIFTYSGNQLSRIAEYVPPILHEGSFDFKDNALSVSGNEYLYDACGSLTADANKGITHIDYDLLGNPVRIQFTDRSYTENVFAADGRKLKTSHITAVPSNTHLALGEMVLLSPFHILSVDSTEYLGDFLFDNGLFKQYHFDGGYFTTTGSEASYKYYVKDHLGSNRILASYNGTIQQETQYYPYGGIHHFSTDQGTQKFKYNGKELDLMHGLNLYDYGARLYDPLVGQFTSIDPLCEKYYSVSPYTYCAGNPVNRIDPDGRDWYKNNKSSYYAWFDGDAAREGFTYIGGKGSVLGEFESIIDNILCGEGGLGLESLYSEGFTFDIAPNDKGGLIGSKERGWDFFDEFVNGTGPEFSVMLEDHPYTEAVKNENFVKQRQRIIQSRGKNGKYTNAGSPQFYPWDASLTSPIQFIGTYRYDGYSSKDGRYINNVVTDTKSVTSLGYHIPFLSNHRRSQNKAFGTTYQFYIWRSKK
jgi:RHS repeat-associated protein